MPSVVWDYFEEFEGGGKCRLCGCIRNRKDKSTSTFWQHLERVHGLDKRLMLSSSPANSLGEGKKVKQTNNFNQINNYSNNNFNITQKRHLEVSNEMFGEEPVEKMPKVGTGFLLKIRGNLISSGENITNFPEGI
uniref:BED-type domain-containing protein n=1 Tax=Meloidogyne enterolobii TaxID=390850 RepID=A0A6V7V385_MELEN|nr:unnamed protein product [Meloidogyne enterolobii]